LILASLATWSSEPFSHGEVIPGESDGLVVLDGDSVRLSNGERVRLLGVDTPEMGQPFSEAAKAFTQSFLADATVRVVPAKPKRDRYGRLLADLTVSDGSLSEALLDAGLAWVYRTTDDHLLTLQAAAVDAGRGIHSLVPGVALGPFRPTKASFHHPECRLIGARREALPLEQNPGCLFKIGLSPCRLCLPWPPMTAATGG